MNTTPSTFNKKRPEPLGEEAAANKPPADTRDSYVMPSYTVRGGKTQINNSGISALVLNRGARFPRRTFFSELEKAGFDSVVSVEGPGEHYDIDDLSGSFPFVKFITVSCPISAGEAVNIGAAEISSPLFFVLWNDLKLSGNLSNMAERITDRLLSDKIDSTKGNGARFKRLCTVPVFQNSQFEVLPSAVRPVMMKKKLELARVPPEREGTPSLFPHNLVGIYDKRRFLDLGCFDACIKSEYWQLLDFGFRAWLAGEEISSTQFVRLRYKNDEKVVNAAYNEDYWRFFFKNLSPVLKQNKETGDFYAHLPLKYLIPFLFKIKGKSVDSVNLFLSAKRWVHSRRKLWKKSAKDLILAWPPVSGNRE